MIPIFEGATNLIFGRTVVSLLPQFGMFPIDVVRSLSFLLCPLSIFIGVF
jgi:hypothetical protein